MTTNLYMFKSKDGKSHLAVLCGAHFDKLELKAGWEISSHRLTDEPCRLCLKAGTDPHKLARNEDPSTSHEAAHATDTARWEKAVYDAIVSFGTAGCIQDDVLRYIETHVGSVPYSTVTARFKALEEKGLIKYTGEKRKGRSGRQSRIRIATRFSS